MEEYKRSTPLFSLCGLNCGLCPRYNTQGESKCPGCGGTDFRLKHPSCAVITCSKKHGSVEYCYQCSSYPCERYSRAGDADSFISYRNVITDFAKVKADGVDQYMTELQEKIEILETLLNTYNDGRRKAFYCNAVNLLSLPDLREIMNEIQETHKTHESIAGCDSGLTAGLTGNLTAVRTGGLTAGRAGGPAANRNMPRKEQIEEIVRLFEARAASRNISLKLRKQPPRSSESPVQ